MRASRPSSLALLVLLSACGESMKMSADLGISAGGSEDIRYAAEMIEGGWIPNEEMFTSEGLMSEHDLPVSGEDCAEVLCPRAAVARIDPVDGSGEQLLVQLGFGTKYETEPFERAPLRAAVAVDVSGSMSDGKLDSVKRALQVMIDQLDEGDEMALVAFDDSAWVVQGMTGMTEVGRESMRDAVERLHTDGGTSIEAGLELAYAEVAPDAGAEGVEDRVMLFTDAQPNVDATGVDSFVGMANYFAEAGIGISVFGVGLDMGTELANAISKTPGGNYYFLADNDEIAKVFDEEFDTIVSPVAYDLRVAMSPSAELAFVEGYGVPLDGADVEMGAATLFLSKRDGGMGATLAAVEGASLPASGEIASLALDYLPVDGAPVNSELQVSWEGGAAYASSAMAADDLGVFKMGVLVDAYLAMLAGSDFCAGALGQEEALAVVQLAAERVSEVAGILEDAPLAELAAMLDKLHENVTMGEGACLQADTYYY